MDSEKLSFLGGKGVRKVQLLLPYRDYPDSVDIKNTRHKLRISREMLFDGSVEFVAETQQPLL